jgi:hypothetical protein
VREILDAAKAAKEERWQMREANMPSTPGEPKIVEVGQEFVTIEWPAPLRGAGDIHKYQICCLDVSSASSEAMGFSHDETDDRAKVGHLLASAAEPGEGSDGELEWKILVELERDFKRHSQVYTLNDLKTATSYCLRIRALNSTGWSPWSSPCSPTRLLSITDTVRHKRVSAIDGHAKLQNGWIDKMFSEIARSIEKDPSLTLANLFRNFDRSNTGYLQKRDVRETLALQFNLKMNDDQVNSLLEEFDADGNGAIDYEEFSSAIDEYRFRKQLTGRKPGGEVAAALKGVGKSKDIQDDIGNSSDSFDSDFLCRDTSNYDPNSDLLYNNDDKKGRRRSVSGIKHVCPTPVGPLILNGTDAQRFEHFSIPRRRRKASRQETTNLKDDESAAVAENFEMRRSAVVEDLKVISSRATEFSITLFGSRIRN